MKKYFKELIILLIQLLVFYITPLVTSKYDMIGMILFMIIMTLLLSIIIGISKTKLKFIYPILISLMFIPSIYIYYNESALIHILWYFIISISGVLIGSIFKRN